MSPNTNTAHVVVKAIGRANETAKISAILGAFMSLDDATMFADRQVEGYHEQYPGHRQYGIATQVQFLVEQVPLTPAHQAPAKPQVGVQDEWSLGDIEGNWRDIDHTGHGGVMRIVWRMEDDERSPACEAKAHAVVAALNAAAQVAAQGADLLRLRDALQFYARGDHFMLSDNDAWDTVSGEPRNLWCDEAGTATVEDGSIAKAALAAQTQGGAA